MTATSIGIKLLTPVLAQLANVADQVRKQFEIPASKNSHGRVDHDDTVKRLFHQDNSNGDLEIAKAFATQDLPNLQFLKTFLQRVITGGLGEAIRTRQTEQAREDLLDKLKQDGVKITVLKVTSEDRCPTGKVCQQVVTCKMELPNNEALEFKIKSIFLIDDERTSKLASQYISGFFVGNFKHGEFFKADIPLQDTNGEQVIKDVELIEALRKHQVMQQIV